VRSDIEAYFHRLVPDDGPYDHDSEGADDIPAHLKKSLTQVQLSIPVIGGSYWAHGKGFIFLSTGYALIDERSCCT
jgi:thiamine phosphate synthase YjbQ (UPF0047 family)